MNSIIGAASSGQIVTGLAHGYAKGKTTEHASQVVNGVLEPASVPIPVPSQNGKGEFTMEHTGGIYTLLGYELAPVVDHASTDVKRYKSQSALQTVALETAPSEDQSSGGTDPV